MGPLRKSGVHEMQIQTITAAPNGNGITVFGLGSDSRVYVWRAGQWQPYAGM